jgi:site-specific DNA-methyltransferase (adenine-specific)
VAEVTKDVAKHQLKTSVIYCGDNLQMLKEIPNESVDLVYIDPPFNSNRTYELFWGDTQEKRGFEDRFGDAQAYITYMRPRVAEMYRVLKKTGSFYYHCDWHASHYVKLMLDQVFSFAHFQNEIIWKRTNNPKGSQFKDRRFGVYTDSIFFYTKSGEYTFELDKVREPLTPAELVEKYPLEDAKGRYLQYPIIRSASKGERPTLVYEYKGYTPAKWGWVVRKENLEAIDARGDLGWTKNRTPFRKYRPSEDRGRPLGNLWDDIPRIQSGSKESLGYPTQKPAKLLERIIEASSNRGDVVLDAFCGCGTALVAAQKLGRKWIGIDSSPTACLVMSQRLWDEFHLDEGKDFQLLNMLRDEKQLREIPPFEFENWAVIALGGIPNKVKVGDYGIDGKLYPVEQSKVKSDVMGLFGDIDTYYPIQVKQKDKAGRSDIDAFEAAMRRDRRRRGYFISFAFSSDAMKEIRRLEKNAELEIIPVTVKELLDKSGFEVLNKR